VSARRGVGAVGWAGLYGILLRVWWRLEHPTTKHPSVQVLRNTTDSTRRCIARSVAADRNESCFRTGRAGNLEGVYQAQQQSDPCDCRSCKTQATMKAPAPTCEPRTYAGVCKNNTFASRSNACHLPVLLWSCTLQHYRACCRLAVDRHKVPIYRVGEIDTYR
jgi:hypothetical protein